MRVAFWVAYWVLGLVVGFALPPDLRAWMIAYWLPGGIAFARELTRSPA
jgi:hypothetical protein